MPWDGNQEVAPGTEEGELTPSEWEAMVADQKGHSGRHEKGGSDEVSVFGDTTHDSVTTEDLSTRSREADAVVIQKDNGDYAALGKDGTGVIDSGAEPHAVINSAFSTLGANTVIELEPNTYTISDPIQSRSDFQTLRGYGATIEAGSGYSTSLPQDYLVYGDGVTNFIVEGVEVDGKYPTETGVGGIWFDGDSVACIALCCEAHHTDSDGGAIDAGITGQSHCIAAFNYCHDIHNREGGIHVTSFSARVIGNTIERDINDDGGSSNTKTEAGLKAGAEGSIQAFNTIRDFTDSRGIYYEQQVHGTDYNSVVKGYGNQVYNCDKGMETAGADLPVHSDGFIARQCSTYGVYPNGGRSIVLSNPFIEGCGIGVFANTFVNYLKIEGGQILDNTDRGIESQCETVIGGTEVDGVTNSQGIYVRGSDADGSRVRDVRVRNTPSGEDDLLVTNDLTDFYAKDLDLGGTVSLNATRPRLDGIGEESANQEEPTAGNWNPGDKVRFTDTGDNSGDGFYQLQADGSTWRQLA